MKKFILKNRKNQKIVGVLEKPEDELKGTAILQHGYGSDKESKTIVTAKNVF